MQPERIEAATNTTANNTPMRFMISSSPYARVPADQPERTRRENHPREQPDPSGLGFGRTAHHLPWPRRQGSSIRPCARRGCARRLTSKPCRISRALREPSGRSIPAAAPTPAPIKARLPGLCLPCQAGVANKRIGAPFAHRQNVRGGTHMYRQPFHAQ